MYVLPLCLFNINRFLLVGKEGPHPTIQVSLSMVDAVVFLAGHDLDLWLSRHIVTHGNSRVEVDEPAGLEFALNGVTNRLLLGRRKGLPLEFAFRAIEPRYVAMMFH